ncbi:hypothetical protein G3T14_19555 [Methylobacterium sp. BTF04]|nr:hypothetical protein [Methylobacterium sp. BTF04]NEU14306.1 hypothetical protein [Methylobacterium sp. BTF04]
MITLPRWLADRLMPGRYLREVSTKAATLTSMWGDDACAVARAGTAGL